MEELLGSWPKIVDPTSRRYSAPCFYDTRYQDSFEEHQDLLQKHRLVPSDR